MYLLKSILSLTHYGTTYNRQVHNLNRFIFYSDSHFNELQFILQAIEFLFLLGEISLPHLIKIIPSNIIFGGVRAISPLSNTLNSFALFLKFENGIKVI